jgi:O-methyltransferase
MIRETRPEQDERLSANRPISISVDTHPVPESPAELYLDLLKRALTRTLVGQSIERQTLEARFPPKRLAISLAQHLFKPLNLELVRLVHCTPNDYLESGDASRNRAEDAETMLGTRQLDHMQKCIADVIRDDIPGDLLEAGVWRGGMTILMRGALKIHGDTNRRVWVADSFAGLPEPDKAFDSFGWRAADMTATLGEVRDNFARYGLLDDQVIFLEGFFSETLPTAPISKLSILRVDADLYESTRDVLESLYPKLSPGGYAVFDDYQNLPDCRRAIDEYRDKHNISEPITKIDTRAVSWQKRP